MPTAVSTFPSSTPAKKGNWHPRDPAAHKSCPRATSHFPVLGEDGAPRHPPTQHPGGGGLHPLSPRGQGECSHPAWVQGGSQEVLGRGLSLQLGRGLWGEAKVLPEQVPSPAFCPLQQMFSLQPVGVRRENPHPASTGWEQRDGSVPALAASPLLRGGGFPQDWGGGGSVLAQGSQGWDLQRRGRGLPGRRPFVPFPPPRSFRQEEESSTVILNAIIF